MSFQQKLLKFFLTNTEFAKPFLNKFVNGLGFGFGMGAAFQIQPRNQTYPPFVPQQTNMQTQRNTQTEATSSAIFNPHTNPILQPN